MFKFEEGFFSYDWDNEERSLVEKSNLHFSHAEAIQGTVISFVENINAGYRDYPVDLLNILEFLENSIKNLPTKDHKIFLGIKDKIKQASDDKLWDVKGFDGLRLPSNYIEEIYAICGATNRAVRAIPILSSIADINQDHLDEISKIVLFFLQDAITSIEGSEQYKNALLNDKPLLLNSVGDNFQNKLKRKAPENDSDSDKEEREKKRPKSSPAPNPEISKLAREGQDLPDLP